MPHESVVSRDYNVQGDHIPVETCDVSNFICLQYYAVQATVSQRVWLPLLVVMDQHRNQFHASSIPRMNFYRTTALLNNSTINTTPNV